jgi:hypothetical protein
VSRVALGKKVRFDIFKRDGFTCQYCGGQPPDCVLVVDHIRPVAEGGDNDPMNLVTSCAACNAGKGMTVLQRPQRPDTDLAWLETQQEVAELRRYQAAQEERERLIDEIIPSLQQMWRKRTVRDWAPRDDQIRPMLDTYSPELVRDALMVVAAKIHSGHLSWSDRVWLPYTWGVLRNMEARHGNEADD